MLFSKTFGKTTNFIRAQCRRDFTFAMMNGSVNVDVRLTNLLARKNLEPCETFDSLESSRNHYPEFSLKTFNSARVMLCSQCAAQFIQFMNSSDLPIHREVQGWKVSSSKSFKTTRKHRDSWIKLESKLKKEKWMWSIVCSKVVPWILLACTEMPFVFLAPVSYWSC